MNLGKVFLVIASLAITQARSDEQCPDDEAFAMAVTHGHPLHQD